MIKTSRLCIFVCALSFFLSGCITDTSVQLDYHPQPVKNIIPTGSKSISVGEFEDVRGETNAKVLAHKSNSYGIETSGQILAERPIAEILRDSFAEALTNAKYRITSKNAAYTLLGKVSSITIRYYPAAFSVDLRTTIQVYLRLIKNDSGTIVWSDMLNGSSNLINDAFCYEDCYKKGFNQAADNLIANLLNSSTFRRVVAK